MPINLWAENEIRLIYSIGPKTLDPHKASDPAEWPFIMLAYNRLFTLESGSSKILPSLAKTLRVSDDGTKYTVILQEGLTFADGLPIDSNAALFTFDRLMNHEIGQLYYPYLKSLEIVGPYTFRLILDRPFSAFPASLTLPYASLISPGLQEKPIDYLDTYSLGSGLYIVEENNKDKLVLKRRESSPKQTLIEVASFYFIKDPAERYQKALELKAHIILEPQLPYGPLPKDYYVQSIPSFESFIIAFNMKSPQMSHENNRQEIYNLLKDLYKNADYTPQQLLPLGLQESNLNINAYPTQKLENSNKSIKNKLTILVNNSKNDNLVEAAQNINKALNQAGFNSHIFYTTEAQGGKILQEATYDLYLDFRTPQFPSPEMWLANFLDSRSSKQANPAQFNNPEVDQLLDDINQTVNSREKNLKIAELNKIALQYQAYLIPFQKPVIYMLDKEIQDITPHPMWPELWPLDQITLKDK